MFTEKRFGNTEVTPESDEIIAVQVACDTPVIIEKVFGPTIFASIRISASLERDGWLIERQTGPGDEWIPWVTIPAQLDMDFEDNKND